MVIYRAGCHFIQLQSLYSQIALAHKYYVTLFIHFHIIFKSFISFHIKPNSTRDDKLQVVFEYVSILYTL